MSRKILIVSEGAHELGTVPYGEELNSPDYAALVKLVHRILNEPSEATYICQSFKDVKHRHGKGNNWYKKAIASIEYAKNMDCSGIVILIDRDDWRPTESLAPLEQARNQTAASCAVGNAVRTFDAWMIADAKAIKTAGGDPSHAHPSPESLNAPKGRAFSSFDDQQLVGFYADIAGNVDLNRLMQSCPKGFEPFYKEILQYLKPLFN